MTSFALLLEIFRALPPSPLKVLFWPRTALGEDPRRRHVRHTPAMLPSWPRFLWTTQVLCELCQVYLPRQVLQRRREPRHRHAAKDFPMLLWNRDHHATVSTSDLISQIVA